jgi:effector-binding domain-containing protein
MKVEFSEKPSGKGAWYKWTSDHKDVGNGKLTISEAKPSEYVKTEMDFMENGTGSAEFFLRPVETGTEVKWTMDTDMGMNPIGKIVGLFMDKMIGSDYEKGLKQLDSVARIMPPEDFTMAMDQSRQPAQKLLVIRSTGVSEKEISTVLGNSYGMIIGAVASMGLQVTSAPLAIYEEPVNGIFTFEAGMAINAKPTKPLPAGIIYKEIPETDALIVHFGGPYEKTAEAYPLLMEKMGAMGKTPAGLPMEYYITDPATVNDPLEIKTDIVWPIK